MDIADEWRRMAKQPIENVKSPGKAAMQLVKDRISEASNASKYSHCDSVNVSSQSTSTRLTGMDVGSHQDALKLYAMSKIDIWTPWAPICEHQTPDACARARQTQYLKAYHTAQPGEPTAGAAYAYAVTNIEDCNTKVHFQPIHTNTTSPELGDCAYLDQCHRVWSGCRYIHYARIRPKDQPAVIGVQMLKATKFRADPDAFDRLAVPAKYEELGKLTKAQSLWRALGPTTPGVLLGGPSAPIKPQFVNCDIRMFDLSTLGDFAVVMADPPWPIHMSLPYGTIRDTELLDLPVEILSKQGLIFLWVTMRAMDLGRRCIKKWGYEITAEVVWVKTNQLNKTIVTGRTGHWLNHTKETCLVGIKGPSPSPFAPLFGQDTDTIVAPMRETSRKPDEIYDMIDHLAGPETRKIELFGRTGNLRPGWLTLGNQLPGARGDFDLVEEEIKARVEQVIVYEPNTNTARRDALRQSWPVGHSVPFVAGGII
ncbi:MAG: hypothetical protein M1830_008836 [Pleopsidium flavum]|nr:MAG: hypothetical protein M1830_008836 [Pleopsidium flavum]